MPSKYDFGHEMQELTPKRWMSKMGLWFVPEPNTGCWLWLRAMKSDGYGGQSYQGRRMRAHQVSWLILRGPVPEGRQLDHLCRTPLCVNPDHLEVVTARENSLRSPVSPTAINARKTHCKHGHPFDDTNTYWYRGHRNCRACGARWAKYKRRGPT